MRVRVKKKVKRGFMGDETRTTTVVFDGAEEGDVLQLLRDLRPGRRALPGSSGREDGGGTEGIEVTEAMLEAARRVFLSRDRVAALAGTLGEVFQAMERARRDGSSS